MSAASGQPRPADGPVAPGTGWPGDLATAATAVARDPAEVPALARQAGTMDELVARQSVCRACPRLVKWREQVAVDKRRSFQAERYWGRPVPGWGDNHPRVLIVGLAPAAHGGNRTGRVFTGDRSGDVLFASLWRCGFAVQPASTAAGDGQRLIGARMAAAVRCAPPQNKPSIAERDACAPWLAAELALVSADLRAIVCLGQFAWQVTWQQLQRAGVEVPRPRPAFGHGAEVLLQVGLRAGNAGPGASPMAGGGGVSPAGGGGVSPAGSGGVSPADGGGVSPADAGPVLVIGCYHPSQQNTFTGRVTDAMLDEVFLRAGGHARP